VFVFIIRNLLWGSVNYVQSLHGLHNTKFENPCSRVNSNPFKCSMACGRREPPRLVNLHSFGLVASLLNTLPKWPLIAASPVKDVWVQQWSRMRKNALTIVTWSEPLKIGCHVIATQQRATVEQCARKFRNVWVRRRRSGAEWTASSS